MKIELFEGVQDFFKSAGENACYAFCIIKIAERATGMVMNPYTALFEGIKSGYIGYNTANPADPDNFYIYDPAAFFRKLTGFPVSVFKETDLNYQPKEREFIVQCWERKTTGRIITHFRLPDWDSLADSQTVKYGEVASLRVFKVG